jgi:biopolymer transport protein ExbD
MSDINVTPLVDVVLVLLIVFMITIPAVVGSAPIDINLPESGSVAAATEIPPMTLTVQRAGQDSLALYINDRPTNRDDLVALFQTLEMDPEEQPITLRADASLDYGEVISVMDMLHSIGLSKISIDTRHVE